RNSGAKPTGAAAPSTSRLTTATNSRRCRRRGGEQAPHLAFRAFGAAGTGAAAAALPFDFDGAFGLGTGTSSTGLASVGLASALAAGDFAASTAMLLRSASVMLTTLVGRETCSVTFAGIPTCLA